MNQDTPIGSERFLRLIVPAAAAGTRIDKVLRDLAPGHSRTSLKKLLAEGHVMVDGQPVRPAYPVVGGEEVIVDLHGVSLPEEQLPQPPLNVLHEDDYILVINKPPGMAAHPAGGLRTGTVAQAAQAHCGGTLPEIAGDNRPGIVHRLDMDTSGVMVLAKTEEAYHFLRAQFKGRTAEKEYRAIVFGEPRFDSDWIERPIATDPAHPDRMRVVPEAGKEAATYWEVKERFRGFTHVLCRPKTGRTHQIRVHMMSIGHSLLGDRVYRSRNVGSRTLPEGAPPVPRQCLHARSLSISHPRTHERMTFEAELPEDMQAILRWLRAHLRPRPT